MSAIANDSAPQAQTPPQDASAAATGGGRSWLNEVERLALASMRRESRVIGITSAEGGVGVSLLSELMAICSATIGRRTLLVDLSRAFTDLPLLDKDWTPGETDPHLAIEQDKRGFARLSAPLSRDARQSFSNIELLRADFEKTLEDYDCIIVDMPCVLGVDASHTNAVAVSTACDEVLMVLATGRTARERAERALNQLADAGVVVSGAILNDFKRVSPADDLSRLARRVRYVSPALARRLERAIRSSSLLE